MVRRRDKGWIIIPGSALCVANLVTQVKYIEDESREVVDDWAEETMTISRENFCPVDKGVLKSTGKTKTITGTTREYAVRLSYGEGIDYAGYVHEIPYNHYNPPTAQYKFLSTPFNQRADRLIRDLEYRCAGVLV